MYLQTARLNIRNFNDKDLDLFFTYRNDPDVAKYQGWGIPFSREKAGKFISPMKAKTVPKPGEWVQFAVALKDTNELIGDLACFVKKEDSRQSLIGFTIASNHWRNGYALEVIHRLLEFLFEQMGMHRITADCDVDNITCGRTLKVLGFRREAHFVESFPVNGVYTSEYHFGLLQREWL